MSDANQHNIAGVKKGFRNLAVGYAIFVPAVFLIAFPLTMEVKMQVKTSLSVPAWAVALLFGSSFVMGILSLFNRSLGVDMRALVFVATVVSAAVGGFLALILLFVNGMGC